MAKEKETVFVIDERHPHYQALKWIQIGKNDLIKSIEHIVHSEKGNDKKGEGEAAYNKAKKQLSELDKSFNYLLNAVLS